MPAIGKGIGLPFSRPGNDIKAIIAIINSMTGQTDISYLSALNTLVVQQGGVGQARIIDSLNELGPLLCTEWPADNFAKDEEGYILYYEDGTPIELEAEV